MSDIEDQEFVVTGMLELSGVTFFIRAASLKEAQEKAKRGEWQDYDTTGASAYEWDLNGKVELNE